MRIVNVSSFAFLLTPLFEPLKGVFLGLKYPIIEEFLEISACRVIPMGIPTVSKRQQGLRKTPLLFPSILSSSSK